MTRVFIGYCNLQFLIDHYWIRDLGLKMAQASETQNHDTPTNFIEMNVIITNGSEDNSPHGDDIGENSLPTVSLNVSTNNLQIPREGSESSLRSRRSTYEANDGLQHLYIVTDVVLLSCAILIAIALFVSLGIFIFGQYRISRGLDHYVMVYED